jgi:hypothetical protein
MKTLIACLGVLSTLAACGRSATITTDVPRTSGARTLVADGKTETVRLIDAALGPNVSETPDCAHPEFGPHITQAPDAILGKSVFVFHIHVRSDNDRCQVFDRQRNEIKTFGPSDPYVKAFLGDTTTYRWRFKLDVGFQPSLNFTHIHQLKAADGDADAPIITITPRAGSPELLQLIHVNSQNKTTIVAATELASFKGAWVEVLERVTWGPHGTFSVEIRRLSDGKTLFSFTSADLDLWRTGTTFVRPKWGIYRSLNSAQMLRDEQVRFDRFCLAKGRDDCPA